MNYVHFPRSLLPFTLEEYGPIHDKEFYRNFYLNGHLNPAGYILTAKMMTSYIDYIVRHNPEDFSKIGLMGTDFVV